MTDTAVPPCTAPDADGDGLCDADELAFGSDPERADSDDDGLNDLEERNAGTDPRRADTDGDGVTDTDEIYLGSNPTQADSSCASSQTQATRISRPVDIIIVVDNSTSMDTEISAVRNNLNQNLARVLGTSSIDYRVIMITRHRTSDRNNLNVCIGMPLSGHACSPPAIPPVLNERFYHYDVDIDSGNSLAQVIRTYRLRDQHGVAPMGWSAWVRASAFKVFIEFSDDETNVTAANFDRMLTTMDPVQFGTPESRNYMFHAIVGLTPKANASDAYQPNEPVQNNQCLPAGQAVNAGRQYQELSRLTGGLRFPLCRPQLYDVIFQSVAMGVITSAALPCSFEVPTSNGEAVDLQRILLRFDASNGPTVRLVQVATESDCHQGAWYLDNTQQIRLCPATCDVVAADRQASVRILAACGIRLD